MVIATKASTGTAIMEKTEAIVTLLKRTFFLISSSCFANMKCSGGVVVSSSAVGGSFCTVASFVLGSAFF